MKLTDEQMPLNDYIIDNVGKVTDAGFIRDFIDTEVYFGVADPAHEFPDGDFIVGHDDEIRLQLADFDGVRMGVFYASKEDSRLGQRFAGMPLIRAAIMICDAPGIDGILLQSESTAWIAVPEEELREAIRLVR